MRKDGAAFSPGDPTQRPRWPPAFCRAAGPVGAQLWLQTCCHEDVPRSRAGGNSHAHSISGGRLCTPGPGLGGTALPALLLRARAGT